MTTAIKVHKSLDFWMSALSPQYRRFHGHRRHLGSGANAAKFTVNVWEKS